MYFEKWEKIMYQNYVIVLVFLPLILVSYAQVSATREASLEFEGENNQSNDQDVVWYFEPPATQTTEKINLLITFCVRLNQTLGIYICAS